MKIPRRKQRGFFRRAGSAPRRHAFGRRASTASARGTPSAAFPRANAPATPWSSRSRSCRKVPPHTHPGDGRRAAVPLPARRNPPPIHRVPSSSATTAKSALVDTSTSRVHSPSSPPHASTHPLPLFSAEEARVRAITDVVQQMIASVKSGKVLNLNAVKNAAARKYGLRRSPKLVELISAVPDEHRDALLPALRAKPVRTASGIAVVAVMSKPHRCPHIATTGNICVYCPGGPDSDFEYSTQSYTGYEPTSMRAIRARYDPYVQARGRVDQLRKLGHSVDKVEYILMGGTFMSLPAEVRSIQTFFTHRSVSTLDRVGPFQLTDESFLYGTTIITVPGLVREEPARRAVRREQRVRRGRGRRVRAVENEVRRADDRDAAGLLPVAASASGGFYTKVFHPSPGFNI